ncbi:hypothetical protein GLAREA_06438 [Glarea lozoyensis ATCC 20868]|uniref:Stress-associated endoplasmic reticulum protein n=2 Tax=Glarea lozoyensis TaxID=101852 RepID=S3D6N4_GLAL2|nr:uncharacterized protein GLAREA_06438 [Glarea lozoyensis ATCC 20868]EHK97910.1 hypothetical protein M7I_6330 [Glarea lozoyensis 74030]EPE33425.1 hypothetical protein GLAREA_06438 [Glarea lozoyensis ATCC 20868]
MTQTPEQRKRNAKYAKIETAKRGKAPQEIKRKQDFKSPISPFWLGVLAFVIFGGLGFELISQIFFK